MKQRVPTIFLKIVIVLIGITSLIFGVFLLPKFANAMSVLVPTAAFFKLPFLICMYAAMIIFSLRCIRQSDCCTISTTGKCFPMHPSRR